MVNMNAQDAAAQPLRTDPRLALQPRKALSHDHRPTRTHATWSRFTRSRKFQPHDPTLRLAGTDRRTIAHRRGRRSDPHVARVSARAERLRGLHRDEW